MHAGVDLGGTKIDALVLEGTATWSAVHGSRHRPRAAPRRLDAIARAVEDAAADAAVRVDQLNGIGIGSPGAVDPHAGTVGFNSNLAGGWSDPYPFAAGLARLTGTPCGWRTTSRWPRPRSLSSARVATSHRSSPSGGGPVWAAASCSPAGDGRQRRLGRARAHRGQARRPRLPLRPSWLRRGVCGQSSDGGACTAPP